MTRNSSKYPKGDIEFTTAICHEKPTDENPFVAESRGIKGYDIQELWRNVNYMDVLLLHFTKDLPTLEHRRALEMLFVGLMNLGPRDLDSRAAMIAGVSKTRPEHLLAIGLLAGESEANLVEPAYRFIKKNSQITPEECFEFCLNNPESLSHLAPGFGSFYGSIDPILNRLALDISEVIPDSSTFSWCLEFVKLIEEGGQGWLAPGLAAAVCISLGVSAHNAVGVYQLAKSVGVVAYGLEQSILPMSCAPLLSDEHYEHITQT